MAPMPFRPVLLLELNDAVLRAGGSSSADLAAWLANRRYRIYELFPHRFRRLDPPVTCAFADCICLPEEHAADVLASL